MFRCFGVQVVGRLGALWPIGQADFGLFSSYGPTTKNKNIKDKKAKKNEQGDKNSGGTIKKVRFFENMWLNGIS